MKVLHISTSDRQGGAAIAAYRLNEALQNEGVDSKMLVYNKITLNPTVERFSSFCSIWYLQPIINQYFANNKSEIWLWSLMIHSKGRRFNGFINS